jgi:hypothetical protein
MKSDTTSRHIAAFNEIGVVQFRHVSHISFVVISHLRRFVASIGSFSRLSLHTQSHRSSHLRLLSALTVKGPNPHLETADPILRSSSARF